MIECMDCRDEWENADGFLAEMEPFIDALGAPADGANVDVPCVREQLHDRMQTLAEDVSPGRFDLVTVCAPCWIGRLEDGKIPRFLARCQ